MKHPPVKQTWINLCIEIHNFHVSQVKEKSNWTIRDTAGALDRSIGAISQSLLVASWLKTHEKQIRRFQTMKDALEFIRDKKNDMKTQELNL